MLRDCLSGASVRVQGRRYRVTCTHTRLAPSWLAKPKQIQGADLMANTGLPSSHCSVCLPAAEAYLVGLANPPGHPGRLPYSTETTWGEHDAHLPSDRLLWFLGRS